MKPLLPWSRRRLLGASLGWCTAAVGAAVLRPDAALAAQCLLTPAQTEGPFYPPRFGTPGNDLVVVAADGAGPRGRTMAIVGRVTDAQCRPVAGAVVEIWQADASGHYAHPGDAAPAARDPHFRYWGRAVSDAEGRYTFRTIEPAAYRMGGSSWRTPHVHFKVRPRGAAVLTTQMYFPGHELNARDYLLGRLSAVERQAALARPEAPAPWAGGSALPTWRFDIALA